MTGLSLLAALLCATLGLCLSTGRRRVALAAVGLLVAASVTSFLFLNGALPMRTVTILAGAGMAAMGVLAWFPRLLPGWLLILLALNTGVWTGMAVEFPGSLVMALAAVLVVVPGTLAVERQGGIGVKVVASWMVAIALLAVSLNTLSMPSYQLDHMG